MTEQMTDHQIFAERKRDFSDLSPNSPHYGWMTPDGDFYYTTYMEHSSFARRLSRSFYNDPKGADVLYANGWLAVHPCGIGSNYLFSWKGHLTDKQKEAVKPFVELYKKWVDDLTKWRLLEELEIEDEEQRYAPEYLPER